MKIQALFALSFFFPKINKDYTIANILPSLKYIIDHDRLPAVSMAVVGCYQSLSDSLGPEYIASAILPTILPLVVDRSMDRRQFETLVDLVKSLMKKMTDRRVVELNAKEISFGEVVAQDAVDPFHAPKQILLTTRQMLQHQRESYTSRVADLPPPAPSLPPPPPPSGKIRTDVYTAAE
jgi:hypothetical protein